MKLNRFRLDSDVRDMRTLLTIIRNARRQSFCNRDTNLARQQTRVCRGGELNESETESAQGSRG